MPATSGRWFRVLRIIATVMIFRLSSSFHWKASLVRLDVSRRTRRSIPLSDAQPPWFSCSNMLSRGNRAPSTAPARRGQLRNFLLSREAEQDGLDVVSSLNSSLDDSATDTMLPKADLQLGGVKKVPATATDTQYSAEFLFIQKLESGKAALLCGGVGAASRLLAVGAGALAPVFLRDALAMPEPEASALLFGVASGFAQGALFGLTYRYVVRSDRKASADGVGVNASRPKMDGFTAEHLGDGCVAAFALTSALGQSETTLTPAASEFVHVLGRGGDILEAVATALLPALPFLPRAAGDLFMYSIIREAIDRALDKEAIEMFP